MSYMAICEKYSERGYTESQAHRLAFFVVWGLDRWGVGNRLS